MTEDGYNGSFFLPESPHDDRTSGDALERPDECPECGFEPADSDGEVADGPDEILENRAELLAESLDSYWRSVTETDNFGNYTIRVQCPECGATVATDRGTVTDGFHEIPDDG